MNNKLKTVKLITIISVIIMFVCIVILTLQFIKIGNLKRKNDSLTTYHEELLSEINSYNTSNAYYGNNREEYLENYAREVLGWGTTDETWYTNN